VLARAFASAPAVEWAGRLRATAIPAEAVEPMDRTAFRRSVLDDPYNRELGRVAAFETSEWGHFEHIGPLIRCGPDAGEGPALMLPAVGEHTRVILREVGFAPEQIDLFVEACVVRDAQHADAGLAG
jgi:crotonobetainyl-CoA:carnitine CoA-transferase CaiB-like acyl-CoA transferase